MGEHAGEAFTPSFLSFFLISILSKAMETREGPLIPTPHLLNSFFLLPPSLRLILSSLFIKFPFKAPERSQREREREDTQLDFSSPAGGRGENERGMTDWYNKMKGIICEILAAFTLHILIVWHTLYPIYFQFTFFRQLTLFAMQIVLCSCCIANCSLLCYQWT